MKSPLIRTEADLHTPPPCTVWRMGSLDPSAPGDIARPPRQYGVASRGMMAPPLMTNPAAETPGFIGP